MLTFALKKEYSTRKLTFMAANMIIIDDLSLDQRREYYEQQKKELRINGTDKPLSYEIKQSSRTTANGMDLLVAASEQEWLIKNVVCGNGKIVFDITSVKNEITRHTSLFNDIMDFSRRLHSVFDHLLIETDRTGRLNQVLNRKEIADKWEFLKNYELAEYFSDSKIDQVKSALDEEIRNPISGLQKDWLYILFFIPFSTEYRKQEYIGKTYKLGNIETKSTFLQGINVVLQKSESLKSITDDSIVLKQQSELVYDFHLFGETEAQKLYKKQYKDLFGKEFVHEFQHKADYVLDKQTGLIRTCKAIISEKLNERIYSEMIYEITQKVAEI